MSQSPQHIDDEEPLDEKLTQLVSYLDGELNDTQMNDIEQSIISDPDMRSHADILSRTWAMLDTLEEVSASKQFTQSTLATVSAEAIAQQKEMPGSSSRAFLEGLARYKILPCFLAGIIGATAGFWVSDRAQERRLQRSKEAAAEVAKDAMVLKNLDMLLNDDLYRIVPDAAALQKLQLDNSGDDNKGIE